MSHLPDGTPNERLNHLQGAEPFHLRTRLPKLRTSFRGREEEMGAIRSLLQKDVAVVTLTGPGGVGKTRLAIQTASEIEVGYPDGIALVDLSPIRDPLRVLPHIAQAIGATGGKKQPVREMIVSALRAQQVLLILDNCEQVLDAMPVVAEIINACPALQVLATSRAPLRLYGEHCVPIPPLSTPSTADLDVDMLVQSEAVQVFIDRAHAVVPGFSPEKNDIRAIAKICRQLDGLPLAIELAAARSRVFTPPALLEHLSNRLDLLVDGPRDRPARQRTLRDTIAWSYDLLSDDEQLLFRNLATFVDGFNLEATRAVVNDPIRVMQDLAVLVDHSLVHRIDSAPSGERFALLDTTREFAWEQLDAHNEADAAGRRHATHFLHLAEGIESRMYGSEMGHRLDHLQIEYPNCRAALNFFIETGDATSELRLAAMLSELWSYRGRVSDGIDVLTGALGRGESAPPGPRAKAMAELAFLLWTSGDRDQALSWSAAALPLARQDGDPYRLGQALFIRASTLAGEGERCEETIALLEEGLALVRDHRPFLEIYPPLIVDLGWAWLRAGNREKGLRLVQQGLQLLQHSHRHHKIGWVYLRLGRLAHLDGQIPQAAKHYAESLRAFRDAGLVSQVGFPLSELSQLLLLTGHHEVAGRFSASIRKLQDETGAELGYDPVGPPLPDPHHVAPMTSDQGDRAAIEAPAPLADTVLEAIAAADALASGHMPSGAIHTSRSHAVRLSDRELDVLSLLAQRYTAPEIADQLFISVRTVERHVSNVYNKLGVNSRRAAAAMAVQYGLV